MRPPRVPSLGVWWGLLLSAAGLLTGGGCVGGSREESPRAAPNVLVFLVDDLRPDLGTYGHPRVQSPAIDRLASLGMRFDRAYAQAPVCNPSRASLLTGLRPDTTRVFDNRTNLTEHLADPLTLPRIFHEQGYFTVSIGKVFHGTGRKGSWTDSDAWDLELVPLGGARGRKPRKPLEQGQVGRYRWQAAVGHDDRFTDFRVARRAISVLEEPRSEPFFMMVGLIGTHPHFEAPSRFFDLYPLETIPLPAAQPAEMAGSSYATRAWSDQQQERFSELQQRQLIRAYWACISFVDEQVGKILSAVDRLGLSRSTIVLLVSDHGYHLGENDWWSKHTLYEVALRVPLIVVAPDVGRPGQATSRLVEMVDILPSLAELAGIAAPAGLEGRSFVPLLADPGRKWKPTALSQMRVGRVTGRTVRTERWRYTEWDGGRRGAELYDHRTDPAEVDNVVAKSEFEEVRRQLSDRLRRPERRQGSDRDQPPR